MNIKEIKESIEILLKEPQIITPFIHGMPGVGKSAIVQQIAKKRNISFIDLRLSQLESSDIRGIPIPDHKTGCTKWMPPETLPFECFSELEVPGNKDKKFKDGGILFLDEINRARFDVLQSVFQLVLDRRVGLHKILDNWFLVCAGNLGDEDDTDITEINDSALNNRFAHFYVSKNEMVDVWLEWAKSEGGINKEIINFISLNPSYLYNKTKNDKEVFCTPRSWEKFSRIIDQNKDIDIEFLTIKIAPSVIGTASLSFLEYLKDKNKVRPKDLLNNYEEVADKIKKLNRSKKYSLANEVVEYIKQNKKINDKNIENLYKFVKNNLEIDHTISILKELADVNIFFNSSDKEEDFITIFLNKYSEFNDVIVEAISEDN